MNLRSLVLVGFCLNLLGTASLGSPRSKTIPADWENSCIPRLGCVGQILAWGSCLLPSDVEPTWTRRLARLAYYHQDKPRPPVNIVDGRVVFGVKRLGYSSDVALHNLTDQLLYTVVARGDRNYLRVFLDDPNWATERQRHMDMLIEPHQLRFLHEERDPRYHELSSLNKFTDTALFSFISSRAETLVSYFNMLSSSSHTIRGSYRGQVVLRFLYPSEDKDLQLEVIVRLDGASFRLLAIQTSQNERKIRTASYSYRHFGILMNEGLWFGDEITQKFMGRPVRINNLEFETLWRIASDPGGMPRWLDLVQWETPSAPKQ